MFLRRSLVHISYMYMIFFMSVHFGGLPPPPYQKAGYATVASFLSPEEWPNEDGRFRPPPPPTRYTKSPPLVGAIIAGGIVAGAFIAGAFIPAGLIAGAIVVGVNYAEQLLTFSLHDDAGLLGHVSCMKCCNRCSIQIYLHGEMKIRIQCYLHTVTYGHTHTLTYIYT